MLPKDSDEQLERLLSGGSAGGQRADALWQRIDARLEHKKRARVPAWWAALLLVPTAAVLLLWPTQPQWVARGWADDVPVELRASCGQGDVPCRVGQPVFLMVTSGHIPGHVDVMLEQSGRFIPVGNTLELASNAEEPVPVRIVPEETDVGGLALEARFVPSGGGAAGTVSLHLEVRP